MLRLSFILALVILSVPCFSQSIKGTVKDKSNEPVPFASVAIYNDKGKVIAGITSGGDGSFNINYGKEQGAATVKVSFIGFNNWEKKINLSSKLINLGEIVLEQDAQQLNAAKVTAVSQRAIIKGDTTELNAEAFKVNPDATAQDLLTKMPGVSNQNGKLQAQGEEVKRVLVDGKEYFGNDVSAALGNLPAELIDRVQIFDEQSEMSRFTGFNDGNTNKALNIITKKGMNKSVIGKAQAGYGTDDRYRAAVTFNKLDNERRISVMAQSNNVNEQNFSVADIVGATGNSGRGGRGANSEFMVNNSRGITKTNALGLNYSDKWGKKVKFTASYFLNRGVNENIENTHREYVNVQNLGQLYQELSKSTSTNTNHRINSRFEYQIDSANSLLVIPRLTLQDNNGVSELGSTMNNANGFMNATQSSYRSQLAGISLSNSILFRHKFNKRRTLTLGFDNTYSHNTGDNNQRSYFEVLNRSDSSILQQLDLNQNSWSVAPSISYTEALSKYSMLMAEYKINYQNNSSDKRFYEYDTIAGEYNFNNFMSNVFESHTISQLPGLSYMFNKDKVQLNLKTSYQFLQLDNKQVFPIENTINQSFSSILPSMRFVYKFTKSKNVMLNYRTSAAAPSISQLQDVLDNSNPLQLRTGNPRLKQNYTHALFTRYNATNTVSGNSIFFMFGGRLSNDYIGSNVFIADRDTIRTIADNRIVMNKGTQLTSPENMHGFFNITSMINYGFPISLIKSNMNVNTRFSYSRTPGIINDQKNYAYQPNFGGGFTLSSNISPNVDFTLGSNGAYNIVRNSTQTRSDNNYYTMNSFFRMNFIFLKSIVFQSDINHNLYLGAVTANNQKYYLWNAAIAYKFLKKKAAELKLSAFDLLKQNVSFSRSTTALYAEDITNNTLTRYFMLTFTYNLRKYNGTSGDNKDDRKIERAPGMGPGPGRPGPGMEIVHPMGGGRPF